LAADSEPVAKAGEVEWQKNRHFYHELEPGTLFTLNPESPNFAGGSTWRLSAKSIRQTKLLMAT
jgi:hypothetical protein